MPANPEHIKLSDYNYELPDEYIAQHPLPERDSSKLLYYNKGNISHHIFRDISELIPTGATLYFNNTKVIPARLLMHRQSGAQIEIFLLQPHGSDYAQSLAETASAQWQCLIGNKKKWKQGEVLTSTIPYRAGNITFEARLTDPGSNIVGFTWDQGPAFAEVLEQIGKIPLPPYIKRDADDEDLLHYQTVYARQEGAVAAPTAGLHFTDEVLGALTAKGVQLHEVTLHVGAGTFLPVTEEYVSRHNMHTESIVLKKETIYQLLKDEPVYCVGTTSMRVIESIYWLGRNLLLKTEKPFFVDKLSPYDQHEQPSNKAALEALLNYFEQHHISELNAATQILIMPGYEFRFVKGLVTNFHMPATTLILLVAAFTKTDWQKIYQSALDHQYRFLSYGDSSLLVP